MNEPHRVDMNSKVLMWAGIEQHPGWTGAFTRANAPGAIPSDTRIEKTRSEEGDTQPDGSTGTVLGSVKVPGLNLMYFVEWDARPRLAISVIEWKVRRCQS